MKKRLILLGIAAALVLLATGCSGTPVEEKTGIAAEPVTSTAELAEQATQMPPSKSTANEIWHGGQTVSVQGVSVTIPDEWEETEHTENSLQENYIYRYLPDETARARKYEDEGSPVFFSMLRTFIVVDEDSKDIMPPEMITDEIREHVLEQLSSIYIKDAETRTKTDEYGDKGYFYVGTNNVSQPVNVLSFVDGNCGYAIACASDRDLDEERLEIWPQIIKSITYSPVGDVAVGDDDIPFVPVGYESYTGAQYNKLDEATRTAIGCAVYRNITGVNVVADGAERPSEIAVLLVAMDNYFADEAHANDTVAEFEVLYEAGSIEVPITDIQATAKATVTQPVATAVDGEAEVTAGDRNARSKAQNYLQLMGFSEKGLRDQLEYDGFESSEIDYAIGNVTVDWNAEATEKAQSYLELMGLSQAGLREQLAYDGFTPPQIEYAISAVYN